MRWHRLIAIVRKEVLQISRDVPTLLITVAMPLLLMLAFGYGVRFDIQHTSAHEKGQVYIPELNWMLMFATLGLVIGFKTSTDLAAAYGMAVTMAMLIRMSRKRFHRLLVVSEEL